MSCSSWQRWHLHRKSVWTLLDLVQWAILVFLKASFGSSHVERRQCFRKVPGWCHSSFLVLRRWFSTQTSHKGLWPWPIWLPTNILPKEPKILRTARKQDRCQSWSKLRWQAGWDDSWQPVRADTGSGTRPWLQTRWTGFLPLGLAHDFYFSSTLHHTWSFRKNVKIKRLSWAKMFTKMGFSGLTNLSSGGIHSKSGKVCGFWPLVQTNGKSA